MEEGPSGGTAGKRGSAMDEFTPADENYGERMRSSFGCQTFMSTIGAELTRIDPGYCEIVMPFRADLCQQNGFIHGGVTGALADTAAGYAAYSLMPADASILTIEYKLNLLAPAVGEKFVAQARVQRAGRTVTVVQSEVVAIKDGARKTVALMLATMMCLNGQGGQGGQKGGAAMRLTPGI